MTGGLAVLALAASLAAQARGAAWVQTSSADFSAGAPSSASVVLAGGGAVRLAAAAEAWTQPAAPNSRDFYGLHMVSNTAAWAVGTLRADAHNSYGVLRYDGAAWSEDRTFGPGVELRGIWMPSEAEGWALGDSDRMINYDTTEWFREVQFDNDSSILMKSLHMSGNADGWAVGASGALWWFDGGAWNKVAAPVTDDLNGVRMLSPTDGWIVGAAGRILRYDGASWTVAPSPTGNTLNSVSMLASGKGFAVGAGGVILSCDGSSWSLSPSPTGLNLSSVWMLSDDEGWAVGDSGTILRYDGDSWKLVTSPTGDALKAVSFASPARGLAAGLAGTFVKWERQYFSSGTLVSSVFASALPPDWGTLSWTAAGTSPGVEVKFQVASSTAAGGVTSFRGPDGATDTYYTSSGTGLWPGHDGERFLRYRAVLSSADPLKTPLLHDVTVSY